MASTFKVLAVDGGGIRGIIPALVLAEIERRTKHSTSDLFDLLAGTSTGGIIGLGLVKPGADGKVEKSATDIVDIYEKTGTTIFPQTFLQGLHLGTIRGAKYDARGLESVLKDQFGDARLKDAVKPVLIPSHDIGKQTPMFFKSEKAKLSPDADFAMRDVGGADVLYTDPGPACRWIHDLRAGRRGNRCRQSGHVCLRRSHQDGRCRWRGFDRFTRDRHAG